MKMLKLFLILFITTIFLTTCKKYPEGGWSNMAIKHLFGGHQKGSSKTWHLKKYEVNGIDSTEFIKAGNGFTSFENDEITFRISINKEYYADSKIYGFSVLFSRKTDNPKIKTIIAFGGGSGLDPKVSHQCKNGVCERIIFNPLAELTLPFWQLIKLKNNEFVITTNQNGNNYKIILTNEK